MSGYALCFKGKKNKWKEKQKVHINKIHFILFVNIPLYVCTKVSFDYVIAQFELEFMEMVPENL